MSKLKYFSKNGTEATSSSSVPPKPYGLPPFHKQQFQ